MQIKLKVPDEGAQTEQVNFAKYTYKLSGPPNETTVEDTRRE